MSTQLRLAHPAHDLARGLALPQSDRRSAAPANTPAPGNDDGPAGSRPVGSAAAPMHPRDELRALQQGKCAGCGRTLAERAYFFRDLGGLRVAALVCMACSVRQTPVPAPLIEKVDPLLRLRLTFGTIAAAPRGDAARLAPALHDGDWDVFVSPLHALLVAQGGRCALYRPDKPARERCAGEGAAQLLYVDHDHDTGLARALLCPPCNLHEGWGAGSPAHRRATELLRAHPPAQACAATAGLTYRWLTAWKRPADYPNSAPAPGPRTARAQDAA